MVTRRGLLLCGVAMLLPHAAFSTQARSMLWYHEVELMLGETTIIARTLLHGPGHMFFRPHNDEEDALKAAEGIVRTDGGACVSFRHGDWRVGERYITFAMGGAKYCLDPNRIFTKEGIKLTVGMAPPQVYEAVDVFAKAVARLVRMRMPAGGVVIGVHNNTPGGYSIKSYSSGDLHGDAQDVFINPSLDADDFFLTTERHLFEALRFLRFNVVLQKKPPQHNDGSFSVFCCQQDIPYVNVEAQHGHGAVQAQMLRELVRILDATPA